jgi:hypothetical protein
MCWGAWPGWRFRLFEHTSDFDLESHDLCGWHAEVSAGKILHRPAAATIIFLLPIANIRDLIHIDARVAATPGGK